MTGISVTSYALAAAAYLIFTILLVTGWRRRLEGGLLVLATGCTVLWAVANASWAFNVNLSNFIALSLLSGVPQVRANIRSQSK